MEPLDYFPRQPEQVKISLTNICNYKCVMCPNASIKQSRGFMDDELVHKIIDECVQAGIKKISLGSSGEVLLHKNFTKYLQYAKQNGLWVSTATNCSNLSPELTDEILKIGIDRINLSVYSANAEEHKNYCGRSDFKEVVSNVKYFLQRWNETGKTTDVKMGFLALDGINDEHAFMQFWLPITQKHGLQIDRKEAINWAGGVNTLSDSILSRNWRIGRNNGEFSLMFNKVIPCTQMPSYIYILHDGVVHPCCNLLDSTDFPEMRFGNINKSTIIDSWQSPRFCNFRKKHFRCDVDTFRPCVSCEARFIPVKITLSAVWQRLYGLLKKNHS